MESWGTLWNLTNSLERAESQGLGHKTNQANVLCQKGLNDFFVIKALCNFELKNYCKLYFVEAMFLLQSTIVVLLSKEG